MKQIKLLIVANNCDWSTWPEKITELKTWFGPLVDLEVTVTHTKYESVPFENYSSEDTEVVQKNLFGVVAWWYDLHISPLAKNHNIVLFVVSPDQWPAGNRARGWRTDRTYGAVELQIAAGESEKLKWNNFPSLPSFFQLARHEICHALYMITGQTDRTHEFWDQGKIELALTDIKFPLPKFAELLSLYEKLLISLKQLLNLMTTPKTYPKIDKFCLAIQKMEGWFEGSRSFRNNNPGNLKYVGQSRATGKDANGFAVFPSYEAGFETLREMVMRACQGKSKVYKPSFTFYDFFAIYAPAEDNNHPKQYAEVVAGACEVLPTLSISSLLL